MELEAGSEVAAFGKSPLKESSAIPRSSAVSRSPLPRADAGTLVVSSEEPTKALKYLCPLLLRC